MLGVQDPVVGDQEEVYCELREQLLQSPGTWDCIIIIIQSHVETNIFRHFGTITLGLHCSMPFKIFFFYFHDSISTCDSKTSPYNLLLNILR